MQEVFDELFTKSEEGHLFKNLFNLIIDERNILLAYRNIKANKGSKTAGSDKYVIDNYKVMNKQEFITLIRTSLKDYKPKAVRRVMIPKGMDNTQFRPLGIPTMLDRLIQQMFKQILEPICEAKFYNHSYGFRPLRSTKHALSRVNFLVNISQLHYVVDIDIKGFFDNVNHRVLMKQMWNLGIHDRRVLAIISKMLKAPIKGIGIPNKGTPQGGILSPLLSNIVLHDLDMWVSNQWETFETKHEYSQNVKKYLMLKRNSNMKIGFIVRYADDFKIMTNNHENAVKWFHAVTGYLKDRLKLDISPEKSKITNLKKKSSDFLGFKIKAVRKKQKHLVRVNMIDQKKADVIRKMKELILRIRKETTINNIRLFNAYVMGIQNYFKYGSMVPTDFKDIAHKVHPYARSKLHQVGGKYAHPTDASKVYNQYYSNSLKTWKVLDVYLFPINGITSFTESRQFNPKLSVYTEEGRKLIHKKLQPVVEYNIRLLMQSKIQDQSIEYQDNRLSRYSMKNGCCEILGIFLEAHEVHCHHVKPRSLGGTDKYDNLKIIHEDMHRLIHATEKETIDKYLVKWKLNQNSKLIEKINALRKKCKNEPIVI
ncbi:group II intron reverse transcriptase/maturase [Niallia sp. FSL W8-1348]|uniref:group II intron reverse transcriptase/maturase n=1 Tax=Niallia sp. FSL W8-1348 TaxID=2954656 RepID=UPI0030F784E4